MQPSSPPPEFDAVADARSTPRRLARFSIAAPFAAVLVRLIASYLENTRQVDLDTLSSNVAALVTLAGLACGTAAVVGALRRRSRDTLMIAGIGLFLGGCWLLLTLWAIVFVNTAG